MLICAMDATLYSTAQSHSPHTTPRRPSTTYLGCSRVADYEFLGKLGEGTFGEVHRARSRKTGNVVALKKIIMHNEKDGFPITALREIKLLKLLCHPNILKLSDMAVEHPAKSEKRRRPTIYMVTPYMDHDLSGLLDNPSVRFTEPQIKCYMIQLLQGLKYLHDHRILHRDMKAANLLINNKGILQIADFGLARHYDGPKPKPREGGGEGRRDYTSLVVTRWYRPPELLLLLKKYTTAIDMWGVGCVFGEMLTGKPILAGDTDDHQLEIIFDLVGSPSDETMPGWAALPGAQQLSVRPRAGCLKQKFRDCGSGAVSLLAELLKLDWRTRYSAIDALEHHYFKLHPVAVSPAELPTFEESHEFDRRKYHDRHGHLPPAHHAGNVGIATAGHPVPKPPLHGELKGGVGGRFQMYGTRNVGNGGNDERRPAWQRDRGLPPRPPPVEYYGGREPVLEIPDVHRDRERERQGRARGQCGRPDVDTYIPSYSTSSFRRDERARDERRRREDREEWRIDRDRPRLEEDRARSRRSVSRSRSPHQEKERELSWR